MKENILGISDSRPPGKLLSDLEASRILDAFGINVDRVEVPYGLEGYYIFYKKGTEFIRCYKDDHIECLRMATQLQDRLAFHGLAPAVIDETVYGGVYTNVSAYVEPIRFEVNLGQLKQAIASLHRVIERILREWEAGLSTVESTSRAMHSMIGAYSTALFDKYEIYDDVISDFYEVLGLIKQATDFGHGDMHPGNILEHRNTYIFIDYESVFQSSGGAILDYYNLSRFDIDLVKKNERFRKINNYLHAKSAIVNLYLEDRGNYVSPNERQKFLRKICR